MDMGNRVWIRQSGAMTVGGWSGQLVASACHRLYGPRITSMAGKKLAIPTRQNEAEELAWQEKHRAAVEADLRFALRNGKAMSLSDAPRLAQERGIGYDTYVRLLLHEALVWLYEVLEKEQRGRGGSLGQRACRFGMQHAHETTAFSSTSTKSTPGRRVSISMKTSALPKCAASRSYTFLTCAKVSLRL